MDRSLPGADADDFEDGEAVEDEPRPPSHFLDHGYKPSRKILALTLAPLIAIPVFGNVLMLIFRAQLIAHHPALLLTLAPTVVYMASASIHMSIVAFFAIVIIRSVIFDPCYFLLGRWYGDAGLRWLQKQSPSSTKWLVRIEEWFPRFGPTLIAFYPRAPVMMMAGASRMRFRSYMLYDVLGITIVSIAVWNTAKQFEGQITSVNGFFGRYWWQITVATLIYAFAMSIRAQIKDGRRAAPSISAMADSLESRDKPHDDR